MKRSEKPVVHVGMLREDQFPVTAEVFENGEVIDVKIYNVGEDVNLMWMVGMADRPLKVVVADSYGHQIWTAVSPAYRGG